MASSLATYLPQDRRLALVRGEALPEHTRGAALFADIAGFTPLTEALERALGHRRGAEELTRQLNRIYTALIAEVDGYGGSVIDFAGDSLMCWFDDAVRLEARDLRLADADGVASSSNRCGARSSRTCPTIGR
jgi:class 3 adenylate cyclase